MTDAADRLAFYERDGDLFVPRRLGASPWNPAAQMGVATGALATHVLEGLVDPVPMTTARLTIDIMGAVPFEPLTATTRVLREGRRLRLLEAELRAGDRTWLRATALRVRCDETPAAEQPPTHPFPGERPRGEHWIDGIRLAGDHRVPGPAAVWHRINCDVVAGTPLRPIEALVMIADCGAGSGPLLPIADWTLANLDIAIHLTRPPRGDWLLLDTWSESAGNGLIVANNRIGDRDGMIASAHQTVFPARR